MNEKKIEKLPYRKNISCLIFNKKGEFLIDQLKNWPEGFWKFPQGGVDKEKTEREAVLII